MSYWYERFTKKHILVFLTIIPVVVLNGFGQYGQSYMIGCIPTASRTLYDWISVERSDNYFEVHPFVEMMLETGCIEWLGFSTCEAVQFQDWMPIWMHNELVSIHIFNVTADQADSSKFQTAELSPIVVDRINSDFGTSVSSGELNLKRKVVYDYSSTSMSRFDETIVTGNPQYVSGAAATPWMTTRLGKVFGVTSSELVYLDINSEKHENDVFALPAPTNKMLRSRSLFYFLSTPADHRRCLFDEDCAQQCTWTGLCEPLNYGHQGTLLPSATLFMNWKSVLELGHWPIPAWDYQRHCPADGLDTSCLNEKPRQVIVFNPETFSRGIFSNSGNVALDKFPDVEFQLWRSAGYKRRDEGCNSQGLLLGHQGKDCSVPPEFVFVGDGLFLSSPRPSGADAALLSEIHSERVTGLRFDYLNVWQINRRLLLRKSNTEQVDTFLELFWIRQQPMTMTINADLQFPALKDYPMSMVELIIPLGVLYTLTYALIIVIMMYSSTCIGYLNAREAETLPFKPQYF